MHRMSRSAVFLIVVFSSYLHALRMGRRLSLSMKWSFTEGQGSLDELNLVGTEGELYFHPSKVPTLKAPEHCLPDPFIAPIYPYSSVLCPKGSDWLNIYEMRYRQMVYEWGDGPIGFLHYAPTTQRLALVGTLARLRDKQFLEDGRSLVTADGVIRFYVTEFVSEKPYLEARVQPFKDFTESPVLLEMLETRIFHEVRCNLRMLQWLYPSRNYTMDVNVLKNHPPLSIPHSQMDPKLSTTPTRTFSTIPEGVQLRRRSDFTFGVMNMLQIAPATMLALLQEPLIEKRMAHLLKIVRSGSRFLRDELLKRKVVSDSQIQEMEHDVKTTRIDLDIALDQLSERQNRLFVPSSSGRVANRQGAVVHFGNSHQNMYRKANDHPTNRVNATDSTETEKAGAVDAHSNIPIDQAPETDRKKTAAEESAYLPATYVDGSHVLGPVLM